MDIDLELPSGHEDRLDTPLTSNTDTEPTNVGGENMMRDADDCKGVTIMNNNEPTKGLEFETKEEAYSFYREYARSVGFGITIKASRRSKKSGRFIDVKIACSRFGTKRSEAAGGGAVNSRSSSSSSPCPKTDCKASMHMKRRQDDGKWFIYCFVKEHNHEICPDDFFHAIKGRNNKQSSASQKKRGLQLALDEGDVESLLDNFMLIQAENPGFFYAVDLDQEKRMRNVFWVDAKGRRDYGNFHDVICFDTTTYLRDKYNVPFAPIFGMNHHLQYILLGCALIGEETSSSTFVWLFRTWLRAVGGQTPGVIISTDGEDKNPIKEAIAEVFPDARHCFSLWHVLRKFPENLPPHVLMDRRRLDSFNAKFNKCIYRSWTEEEFQKRWWKMIDRFELREDDWVQSLYVNRKKWVPTYMRGTCLSGLLCTATTTTELGGGAADESTTTFSFFFDKLFTNRETTTIKELMENYRVFLHSSYEEEAKADSRTRFEQPTLRSVLPFEKQMSTVYTRPIFEKFQVEVLGTVSCNLLPQKEYGGGDETTTLTFRVDDLEKRGNFIVAWDEVTSDISCLCRLFEYRGFLCRHTMVVLEMCGVSSIPSHCILKRWTKDAKKLSGISTTTSDVSSSSNRLLFRYRVQRFNDLCKLAVKLGGEGSLSQETYSIALYGLEQALKQCVGVSRNSVRSVKDPEETLAATQRIIEEEKEENHSSYVAMATKKKKKKKPQKKQKVQSETEVISIRMQECSQQMEMLNQRAQAFDTSSYIPQQDMQEMDMGSRTANPDGYYVPQQSIQAVGQLSLPTSGRDGYYSNQQSMHGLGQLNSTQTRIGHYVPQQSLQELLHGQLSFRAPTMHGCFDIQDSLQQEEHEVEDMEQSVNVTSKHLHDKRLPQ